jgi:type VI secretion system protein VasJ
VTQLEDIAKLGTAAIPGDSPAGAAARYDPEFEELQAEIEKIESVAAVPVKWTQVTSLSSSILAGKSKDLLASAYLALGLFQVDGYPGLAAGLAVFRDLLATYWDTLFPPIAKMRGREGAVRWLDERLAKALSSTQTPSESDREPLKSSSAVLDEIASLLRAKFPDGGPPLIELPRTVRDKIESIPPPPPPPEEGAAGGGAQAPAAAPPPPPDVIDTPEKALEAILEAAEFLRKADPADPLPYRLVRAVLWRAAARPRTDRKGVAELAGGDAGFLETALRSLEEGEHAKVLENVESRLPSDRLWLDLQLLAVRAMEGLGPSFEEARRGVTAEMALLLRRIPDLPGLQFEGGLPLASQAARLWIENEVVAPPPAVPGNRPGDGTAADRLAEALREARKLAARGQLPPAITLLQKEMSSVPQGRERFLWRMELAKLCADSAAHSMALPLFESLDEEAVRYRLEEWETQLSVEVVKRLWQCYSALPKQQGAAEKAAQAYARLCRLDLSAAMALGEKEK